MEAAAREADATAWDRARARSMVTSSFWSTGDRGGGSANRGGLSSGLPRVRRPASGAAAGAPLGGSDPVALLEDAAQVPRVLEATAGGDGLDGHVGVVHQLGRDLQLHLVGEG